MFEGKLRTCEALRVEASDIIFSSEYVKQTTIRLGKTKNGREQASILERGSLAERMPRVLVRCCRGRSAPFFCFGSYALLHKSVCKFRLHYGLTIELTPHSLRAGGATDDKLCGKSLTEIQDSGRWESLSTCKTYIDIVYAVLPETIHQENLVPEITDRMWNV